MTQFAFRLAPGQLLKEEIEAAVRERGISAGVILSAVGSLEKAVLRMAGASPAEQDVRELAGPWEIVSATGTLSREGCHIHISVSDREGKVVGGHLKDGCVVGTTAEIVLGVFPDATFARTPDPATGFGELEVK